MTSFKQVLMQVASPRLEILGYSYDSSMSDRNILFGFNKALTSSIKTTIQFQRRQVSERPTGSEFTVNLIRSHAASFSSGTAAPKELWARLGEVLWFVFNLRLYPTYDKWWDVLSNGESKEVLDEVLGQLDKYGIPWLENPNSEPIGITPKHEREHFELAVDKIISPTLELLGYKIMDPKKLDSTLYSKLLNGDKSAFIEFKQISSMEGSRLGIDVILQRKSGDDPHDFSQGQELFASLNVLAKLSPELEHSQLTKEFWEYESEEELENCLKEITLLLKSYAIGWLEDPTSKDISSFSL